MKDLPVTSIQALHERIKAVRDPITFEQLGVLPAHRDRYVLNAHQCVFDNPDALRAFLRKS